MTDTAVRPAPPQAPAEPRRRPPRRPGNIVVYAVLGALALVVIFPLVWMLLTSVKTDADAVRNPYALPDPASLEAYQTLLLSGQQPIFLWLWNSFAAATLQTVLILVTASMAAYALARLEFAGRNVVFGLIIATLLVPPVVFLIPNYLIVENFGWLDTVLAITVPGAASAFGVFFLRQFFLGVPVEIEEAARIDGAGEFRIFFQVALPLAKPALATLAVLSFLGNWNDFLWPVYVLLSPENMTLQPGLAMLQGAYRTHFGIVMAGAAIASIPVLVLFAFAQRQIVDSVAGAAVKG
ncbi:carbohydrate ABC transporter permease [Microbacterium sp. EYE_5]|uniref:carbohydrate ABC transporter permease n=1 Tax=unclassified Microbacterium TaxID=2609290 RepID=UPI002005F1D4|nr:MULTISPECIES: carbohydrate ABC transporter permease [unclassified Microbacterium]MCK6080247.1 carbohydrate ABC transporter permease [Microbacterium sp. EYE_382]MCK6085518.1 carbohydrate ABC transporter permease [Microbacterium sp. EYE_384]MCK6122257.1 carbohydrate ABC transporter permease [Microbacterium sp. EYE_80]MCK6126281.1 carbohydrate ABC transporter permease [Microbacterium sp. EYE_79]MCK6141202.1 carbohydrate ABC transporter permease [Microbacterium sp. EYE_39]